MATSRFYLRADTVAPVSPAFSGSWTNTTDARRRYLAPNRLGTDAHANGDARTWAAGELRLDRQYVSDMMARGIVFTGALVRCIARVIETAADDNAFTRFGLRVCSGDGTVIRATLLAVADYSGAATEYDAASQLTRRWAHEAAAICAAYTTQEGDRLVAEIGHTDAAGVTPGATVIYGSSSAEDHSSIGSSSAFNPWLDVSIVSSGGVSSISLLAAGGSAWASSAWSPTSGIGC